MKISNAAAKAMVNALVALIDAGGSAGTVVVYSGSIPDLVSTALTTQTALATFTLSYPAFGGAIDADPGARAIADTFNNVNASASGTASFARVFDSNGIAVGQFTVGTSSLTSELTLDSVSLVAGQPTIISSLRILLPES